MTSQTLPEPFADDLKLVAVRARLVAQPADFEQLIADGLLRKTGTWYEVLCMDKLPDHITAKIKGVRTKDGKYFVQFMSGSGARRLVTQLDRLGL